MNSGNNEREWCMKILGSTNSIDEVNKRVAALIEYRAEITTGCVENAVSWLHERIDEYSDYEKVKEDLTAAIEG